MKKLLKIAFFIVALMAFSAVASAESSPKPNANNTGVGPMVKAVTGQRVHGQYQNNTNSCASCHQTHTASGDKLLFKTSTYETCMACHNGTMGYLNVNALDPADTHGAGTFGGTAGASMHNVNANLTIANAPGANASITDDDFGEGDTWTTNFNCASCHDPHGSYSDRLLSWNPNNMAHVERVSNADEASFYGNKLMEIPVNDGSTLADKAARDAYLAGWLTSLGDTAGARYNLPHTQNGSVTAIYSGIKPGETAKGYEAIRDEADIEDAGNAIFHGTSAGLPWTIKQGAAAIKFQVSLADVSEGGEYYNLGLNAGDYIVQVYRLDLAASTPKWVPAPFLQAGTNSGDGIDFMTASGDLNEVNFDINTKGTWKANVAYDKMAVAPGWAINGAKGYVRIADTKTKGTWAAQLSSKADVFASITKVTNVRSAFVTKFNIVGYNHEIAGTVGNNKANSYNVFCASCHVDYLTNQYALHTENPSGTGTEKYFHHTMSNSYTCVRCHFAHGTDAKFMMDAAGQTVADLTNENNPNKMTEEAAVEYLTDKNPSSALKRYVNMSVCYGCHQASHADVLVNNGQFVDGTRKQVSGLNANGDAKFYQNDINPGTPAAQW